MVHNGGVYHYHKKHMSKKTKKLVDKIVFSIIFLGPIVTIPQATKIWWYKEAASISIISWTFYMLIAIAWVTYGFVHREKPIIIAYSCWICLHITIIVGAIIYG